jgi:hypothetical protein
MIKRPSGERTDARNADNRRPDGLWGLVFGAMLGAIIGLISHAPAGGRRDFSSVGGMRADRYDVVADPANRGSLQTR